MRILLLGSGGREHALAWKISQSERCSALFIAPGNAGTLQHGTNVNISLHDFAAIHSFCVENQVEMVVVGPEEPLVNGIVDYFQASGATKTIMIIGPAKLAAQLEGSKSFAKAFMKRHGIPTAAYAQFDLDNYDEGISYLQKHSLPIVLKADGLAAGKGVVICKTHAEALAEFDLMLQKSKFGEAGSTVVVEEFLVGIELSVFVLTDGANYFLLPEAKDYKRIGEGDTGLNTGGMGAVSPVPFATTDFMHAVENLIIRPTIRGLADENVSYQGVIFFGLIKVGEDPFVIEYNCRFGDPETEVIIPRLQNDLVELFEATAKQGLDRFTIQKDERAACTVVAVSGGYPGSFEKGFIIEGLEELTVDSSLLFHAATKEHNGQVVTNGGRVFCVTSFGDSLPAAVNASDEVLRQIHFTDMYYRSDIGYEFQ